MPFPTLGIASQRAIADYLDCETARIDALIVAKTRMVELLEERAAAFVESLAGDEKWPRIPLTRIIVGIEQGWSPQCDARVPDDGEWGVLKVGCVKHGTFRPEETKALPVGIAPKREYLVRNGDFLISRANTRDLVGSAAIVSGIRTRSLLCDKLFRIHFDEYKVVPSFMSLWMRTREVRSQLELDATGASDSMQNIGQDTIRRIAVPLPEVSQQEAFVHKGDREGMRLSAIIAAIRQQTEVIKERRRSLVTAVVTGQLDVLEAA
jgi:type I restriction enzyme S subunit